MEAAKAGRLDLGLDANVAGGQPGVGLHLADEQVERHDFGGGLHLGQHHLFEALAGVADDLDDIEGRPLRVPRVDAHAQDPVAPVLVLDGVDDLGPGRLLLQRRHRVLEVEEDHVGRDGRALAEHLLAGAGDRQAGATGEVARACRHGAKIMRRAANGRGLGPPSPSDVTLFHARARKVSLRRR